MSGYEKPFGVIEGWRIIVNASSPYRPPEQGVLAVSGLYRSTFQGSRYDEQYIKTSELVRFCPRTMRIKTKNSEYKLGKIDPDFEKWMKENDYTIWQYEFGEEIKFEKEWKKL